MKYDKGTFITVPKASIIGIGVGPQALYMWLCNYANVDGDCFPSRATLANNMGCSERTVDAYLDDLIALGLVVKEARYSNNKQVTNNYYLPIGVANPARGVAKSAPTPSQNLRTELNPVLTQSTYTSESEIRVVSDSPQKNKKYPHSKEVFALWGKYPRNWSVNRSQLAAAENLFEERGITDIKEALAFYKVYKDDPYCPTITSPFDLDSKWAKLEAFYDRK